MEPSTLAPKPAKPAWWWVLVTIAAGAVGSLAAIGVAGRGTYDIAPFSVEFRAWPAALGKTELAIGAVQGFVPSHAEAGTHRAPMAFRATIVGVSAGSLVAADRAVARSPNDLASFLADDGKSAIRSFGIKLALLSAIGAVLGGLAVSLGRWRRVVGALVAGLLSLAVIGLQVQRTYDKDEFRKTRYVVERSDGGSPSVLPSL